LQDKAPLTFQQAAPPHQIRASFGSAWNCIPQPGRITASSLAESRFDGAGGVTANAYAMGLNRHKNKDGTAGGRARTWNKKQVAAAHLIELCPDIHAAVNLSHMTDAINVRFANDPQRPTGYKVDRDTVREALKMLREKNPR
jgi:hypothetical protein